MDEVSEKPTNLNMRPAIPSSKPQLISIRPCAPADLPFVQTIYNHYVRETTVTFDTCEQSLVQLEHKYQNIASDLPYLVATTDDPDHPSVLGYAYAVPYSERPAYRHTVEITLLLQPDYLRYGIGKQLLDALIAALRRLKGEDGKPIIYQTLAKMSVNPFGDAGNFYLREGWEEIGTLRQVGWKFGKWIDVKIFQKGLQEDSPSLKHR